MTIDEEGLHSLLCPNLGDDVEIELLAISDFVIELDSSKELIALINATSNDLSENLAE